MLQTLSHLAVACIYHFSCDICNIGARMHYGSYKPVLTVLKMGIGQLRGWEKEASIQTDLLRMVLVCYGLLWFVCE